MITRGGLGVLTTAFESKKKAADAVAMVRGCCDATDSLALPF